LCATISPIVEVIVLDFLQFKARGCERLCSLPRHAIAKNPLHKESYWPWPQRELAGKTIDGIGFR